MILTAVERPHRYVGLMLGPIVGGLVAEVVGFGRSLAFATAMSGIQLLVVALFYSETLAPSLRPPWCVYNLCPQEK